MSFRLVKPNWESLSDSGGRWKTLPGRVSAWWITVGWIHRSLSNGWRGFEPMGCDHQPVLDCYSSTGGSTAASSESPAILEELEAVKLVFEGLVWRRVDVCARTGRVVSVPVLLSTVEKERMDEFSITIPCCYFTTRKNWQFNAKLSIKTQIIILILFKAFL